MIFFRTVSRLFLLLLWVAWSPCGTRRTRVSVQIQLTCVEEVSHIMLQLLVFSFEPIREARHKFGTSVLLQQKLKRWVGVGLFIRELHISQNSSWTTIETKGCSKLYIRYHFLFRKLGTKS
jgi:hypothetical protein